MLFRSNREVLSRSFYEQLTNVDLPKFVEQIDRWVLEFAEIYAGQG